MNTSPVSAIPSEYGTSNNFGLSISPIKKASFSMLGQNEVYSSKANILAPVDESEAYDTKNTIFRVFSDNFIKFSENFGVLRFLVTFNSHVNMGVDQYTNVYFKGFRISEFGTAFIIIGIEFYKYYLALNVEIDLTDITKEFESIIKLLGYDQMDDQVSLKSPDQLKRNVKTTDPARLMGPPISENMRSSMRVEASRTPMMTNSPFNPEGNLNFHDVPGSINAMAFDPMTVDPTDPSPMARNRAGHSIEEIPLEMYQRMNNLDVKLFKFPWRILLDGLQTHFYGVLNPMSNYFATYKPMGNDDDGQCVMKILRILNSKVQNEFVQVKNVVGDTLKHKDSFSKKIDAVLVLNAWNDYCKVQWRKNLLHLKKKVPYDPYFLEIIGIMSQHVKNRGGEPLGTMGRLLTQHQPPPGLNIGLERARDPTDLPNSKFEGLRGRSQLRNPSLRIIDHPSPLETPENTHDSPDPVTSPWLGPIRRPTSGSGRNIRKKAVVIIGSDRDGNPNQKMTIVNSLLASGAPSKHNDYLTNFRNLRISQTV